MYQRCRQLYFVIASRMRAKYATYTVADFVRQVSGIVKKIAKLLYWVFRPTYLKGLLLLLTFIVSVIYILFQFDFSPNLFSAKRDGKTVVAIYTDHDRNGEYLLYVRALEAANKLGIEYVGCAFDEASMMIPISSHLITLVASAINYLVNPLFNLALTHHVRIIPHGFNVLYVNVPSNILISNATILKGDFKHIMEFDAYADIRSIMEGSNPELIDAFVANNKAGAPYKFVPVYLSTNNMPMMQTKKIDKAVLTGTLWGSYREQNRFKRTLKKLADNNFLDGYGGYDLKFLGKHYHGFLKHSSADSELLNVQNKGGISLIVHTSEHMAEGIPTSRLPESIVAGTLVISDMHPFIIKYFGDSLLYFDNTKSSAEMYQTIAEHIQWARSNPEEAQVKINKAYDIWAQHFTYEQQFGFLIEEIRKLRRGGKNEKQECI